MLCIALGHALEEDVDVALFFVRAQASGQPNEHALLRDHGAGRAITGALDAVGLIIQDFRRLRGVNEVSNILPSSPPI